MGKVLERGYLSFHERKPRSAADDRTAGTTSRLFSRKCLLRLSEPIADKACYMFLLFQLELITLLLCSMGLQTFLAILPC